MSETKSTITSKGQITLPKTIRDVMNLNTGDQVKFTIHSSNKVVMEKEENSLKTHALMNLTTLLLKDSSLIVIKGKSGCGKTYFAKKILISQFNNQKVAVIEPYNEGYNQLKEHMTDFTYLVTNERNEMIPNITTSNYELVVVDEAGLLDFELIKEINQIKQKMILIAQSFQQNDLLELGRHISITVDRTGVLIEKYELVDSKFIVSPIYID